MSVAYVALGANLGDRLETLRKAVARLGAIGTVEAVSSIYETAPAGIVDQPRYLNAVLRLWTELSPQKLLGTLLAIESELGRVRTIRNAPRTIDLDVLLYGDLVIDTEALTVPHPRMHERAFVMVPLAEIAGAIVHPVLRERIDQLLLRLGPIDGVEPFAPAVALEDEPRKRGRVARGPKERRERR